MGYPYIIQGGLKPLTSKDSSATTSQAVGTTGALPPVPHKCPIVSTFFWVLGPRWKERNAGKFWLKAWIKLRTLSMLSRALSLSYIPSLSVFLLFFFFKHQNLNSEPTPWTTPSALFCDSFFFQERVSGIIWLDWLGNSILLISASWVARITVGATSTQSVSVS
jgi:hypothetical protein